MSEQVPNPEEQAAAEAFNARADIAKEASSSHPVPDEATPIPGVGMDAEWRVDMDAKLKTLAEKDEIHPAWGNGPAIERLRLGTFDKPLPRAESLPPGTDSFPRRGF